ncbi:MAG: c-type cytochrome biogenesis protein CcmI [Granulosicoccus sp.]|nr:c-type cytochrome biogenesis protein CcmI [Granulosicoccus sp.]
MSSFYIVAAMMLLVTLMLIVPVFWRTVRTAEHDQHQFNVDIAREALAQLEAQRSSGALSPEEFADRRAELEQNLAVSLEASQPSVASSDARRTGAPTASAKMMGGLLCVLIPAASIWMYFETGTPQAMDDTFLAQVNNAGASADKLPPIDELLPRLEAHLKDNPDDLQGWRMLGVTLLRLQRFPDAETALEEAYKLDSTNVDVIMQLIDARTMARQGEMDNRTEMLLNQVLQLSPQDPRGLWILGMFKHQRGDVDGAIASWETLLAQLGDQPEAQAEVRMLIEEAANGRSSAETAPVAQNDSASLSVEVSVDAALMSDLPATAAVFIYAKATEGPPMPLAVVRQQVSDLPVSVTLTDEMAMMPQLKLSQFESVTVGARVSLSGDPVASTGDYFTELPNITVGDGKVLNLNIDQRVP